MNSPIQSDYAEIDILQLLRALWKRIWVIVLAMVLMGALFFSYAIFFVTPMYQSTAMMYVNNSSISLGAASFSISELTAAKSLLDVYVVVLKSRTTLEEVIDRAGLEYSHDQLRDMVEAASVNDTEVFRITATSPDPAEAKRIVDTIVDILPDRIADIVDGSSVRVVDYAIRPTIRSSPSYAKYAVIGMVFGAAISCAAVVILELMDTTVKEENYLRQTFGIPVLAVVPDVYATRKISCKKYDHSYYDRHHHPGSGRKKKHRIQQESAAATIGNQRSFANAEAHKRLRTNVLFRFSDDKKTCVIGVTSAMAHEGKSTTAINLAYDMMKAGKRVLLMDADMRFSRIAMNLEICRSPGLSNMLVGSNGENIVQRSPVQDHLPVISCGDFPPNPTELLSSKRMNIMLETLKEKYEYIIIDLPPVSEVADALIVSRLTDGMVVVVRQDYADQCLLADTIQQLRHNEANIIGFVMTCAKSETKYYKNKKYYGRKYGYDHSEQAPQEREKQDDVSV